MSSQTRFPECCPLCGKKVEIDVSYAEKNGKKGFAVSRYCDSEDCDYWLDVGFEEDVNM